MRYQLAVLGLAAMLGVLPSLTTTTAAPAPKRPKRPEIYALIYVGLGMIVLPHSKMLPSGGPFFPTLSMITIKDRLSR